MTVACLINKVFCVLLFVPYFNTTGHYYEDYDFIDTNYTPLITVKGKHIPIAEHKDHVLIEPGETIEIFCTGRNKDLELYTLSRESVSNRIVLPVEIINPAIVRYVTTLTENQITEFRCKNVDTPSSMYTSMTLVVNGSPDVSEFYCVSNKLESISCAWTSNNKLANFTLSIIEDQVSFICFKELFNAGESDYLSCTRKIKNGPQNVTKASTLVLLMEHCNYTHCLNKTFHFNHLSIVKLDRPILASIARYRNGGEKSAFLSFSIPIDMYKMFNVAEYKVEYKMFGSRAREVNTSVLFKVVNRGSRFLYGVSFDLPCSGRKYDIFVSVKTKAALDSCWSDRSNTSYTTPISKETFYEDIKCSEEDIEETPTIMVYDLRKFRDKFSEEQSLLRREIRDLKARVAQKER